MRTRTLLAPALLSLCALTALPQAPSSLTLQTPLGTVRGKVQETPGGAAHAFLGLPFAQPPVGPLRWKPPVAPSAWTGVREATSFGPRCMQLSLYDDMYFRDPGVSEDCLTLNVWTPTNARPGDRLPVMVWIYGGGFITGSTSEWRQDGAHLATKGVIVVSLNYRMNIFGFFTHPDLEAESPVHATGNYGLMDAVAALQWVDANIEAFGGDPHNKTIFGESAGSFAVSALMASPQAHGLFAHAIGESGGALGGPTLRFEPAATREKRDAEFAHSVLHADSLAALRALPAEQLLEATRGIHIGPDVDGAFLPQSPAEIFATGKQNDVPLLAGWNHDEGGSGKAALVVTPTGGSSEAAAAGTPSDLERLHQTAQSDFGDRASEFLAAFPATTDAEALTRLQQYATYRFIALGTWKWIDTQSRSGKAPVYRYEFDLVPPVDPARPGRYGAFHSDEIEYVFGVLDSRRGLDWRGEDYALSEQMMTYWTNFARYGDPNGRGKQRNLPNWPVYTASSGYEVMHLDSDSHPARDDARPRELFLESAWTR